ncbi:YciI family protein [Actinomycetospora straminea]|uniref:YciI family protein n=1 Tax=Actinomycetospora straminea TaxID=663607 RepID=A0ABP9E4B1_9PSEU|nr:YciI family protein [Actinomycetospora straminea]MDD7934125.1 YciI family protein [Actinomycetospora straminea]
MGQYLILIYTDDASHAAMGEQEVGALMAAHQAFGAEHGEALRGGGWLHPAATATSVRRPDGRETNGFAAGEDALVTDGPYGETKEALGGYYLVEAPDLDAALAIARDVPEPFGGVEVRPLRPTVQQYS